jgi:hypothetical protein
LKQVRKRHFLSHLYIKINILPRQARDEHRENSKKVPFSLRELIDSASWAQQSDGVWTRDETVRRRAAHRVAFGLIRSLCVCLSNARGFTQTSFGLRYGHNLDATPRAPHHTCTLPHVLFVRNVRAGDAAAWSGLHVLSGGPRRRNESQHPGCASHRD